MGTTRQYVTTPRGVLVLQDSVPHGCTGEDTGRAMTDYPDCTCHCAFAPRGLRCAEP